MIQLYIYSYLFRMFNNKYFRILTVTFKPFLLDLINLVMYFANCYSYIINKFYSGSTSSAKPSIIWFYSSFQEPYRNGSFCIRLTSFNKQLSMVEKIKRIEVLYTVCLVISDAICWLKYLCYTVL